jgi:hypothetical protein
MKTKNRNLLIIGSIMTVIGMLYPLLRNQIHRMHGFSYVYEKEINILNYIQILLIPVFFFGVAFLLYEGFRCIFSKTVEKYCTPKTTLMSFLLSALGGGGIWCFYYMVMAGSLGARSSDVDFIVHRILSYLCLFGFFISIGIYLCYRKKTKNFRGILPDILQAVLFLIPFGSLWMFLDSLFLQIFS